jgi:membrane associated rhomboid family serine protease
MLDLMVALVSVAVVSVSGYFTMRLWDRTIAKSFRVALWCAIGGLGLYVVYAFGLSYMGLFDRRGEPWSAGGAALIGSAVSLFSAWLIDQRRWSRRVRVSK